MENDREPYFILECDSIDTELQNDNQYLKKKYTITNKGGLITGSYLSEIWTRVVIEIPISQTSGWNKYTFYFSELFEKSEGILSLYNDEKQFVFYGYDDERINEIIDSLCEKIKELYPDPEDEWERNPVVHLENIVEINYVNYKNEEYIQTYQFWDTDKMTIVTENQYDDEVPLGSISINEDSKEIIQYMYEKIKEKEKGIEPNTDKKWFSKSPNVKRNKIDALKEAKRYFKTFSFSYYGLIKRLEKNGYSHEDAIYAANYCGANWNEQVVKTAKNYLHFEACSYNKLLDDLILIEKFTYDQAVYGISKCEVDWNDQARLRAESYTYMNKEYSYDKLVKLLENEGFTHEQAIYGVKQSRLKK